MKRELVTTAAALLAALLAGALLVWFVGESPLSFYSLLLKSTWGNSYGFGQVLFRATPLVFTGLAVAVAFRVGLFNIGGEGQLALGSFVTAMVGLWLPSALPGPVAVAACIAAGMLAGAALAAIAGVLKTRTNAHEVINTMMLNFIVSGVVLWLGNRYTFVSYTTHTATLPEAVHLSSLGFRGSAANTSLFLAVACAAGYWFFFRHTRRGFEWRAIGKNLRAAQNGGVDVGRAVIGAMALSGALAGAVGANFVLGYKHYFERDLGSGYGFKGIAVALLGRNHPVGIVVAALLLGTLDQGGLAVSTLVPKDLVRVLEAVIILTAAAAAAFELRAPARKSASPVDKGEVRDE